MNREKFLKSLGLVTMGVSLTPSLLSCKSGTSQTDEQTTEVDSVTTESNGTGAPFFTISLAQWSLHRTIHEGKLDPLDFPKKAKEDFGITAVEYVNQLFMDKATDRKYIGELKLRCDDLGVTSVLLMCDREGDLGDADAAKRKQAVENHYKWVEAAKFLGCHSIRVNARGEGSREEVAKNAAEGLHQLATFAKDYGEMNVIVENHGGYSSDGTWLSGVMNAVNMPNCGTLPDFGNFCMTRKDNACTEEYDRYKGVKELMPYAKGVSAKTHDFDEQGNCVETDYARMLKIVKDAGYNRYIGIEYEGNKLSEDDGIRATLALLKRVSGQL